MPAVSYAPTAAYLSGDLLWLAGRLSLAVGRPSIWITYVAIWTFVVFSGIRAPRTAVGSWAAGHLHAGSLAQLTTSGTSPSAPSFPDQQSVSVRT